MSPREKGGTAASTAAAPDKTRQLIAEQLFSGSQEEKLLVCIKVFDQKKLLPPGTAPGAFADSEPVETPVSASSSKRSPVKILPSRYKKDASASGGAKEPKERYLCITVKRNGKIRLHKIKQASSAFSFQIGKTWQLEEVRTIEDVDQHQFIVTLNKQYIWAADDPAKKSEFVFVLFRLCRKYLKKQPKLININEAALQGNAYLHPCRAGIVCELVEEVQSRLNADEKLLVDGEEEDTDSPRDHDKSFRLNETLMQFQQEKEEVNFDAVLMDYDWKAGGDASALETRLNNELIALEAANIHAIIQAEDQSNLVIGMLGKAITELDAIDEWLTLYSEELNNMGKDIRHIESQNRGLQLQTANQKLLLKELENLFSTLALNDDVIETLHSGDLFSADGIRQIEEAANKLEKALQTKIDNELSQIEAIAERMANFAREGNIFATRLVNFLTRLIKVQMERFDKEAVLKTTGWRLQSRESLEEQLLRYRELIQWLKNVDPKKYSELQTVYVQHVKDAIKRSIKDFFERLIACHIKHKPLDELNYIFYHGSLVKTLMASSSSASLLQTNNPVGTPLFTRNVSMSSMISAAKGHRKAASAGEEDKGRFGSPLKARAALEISTSIQNTDRLTQPAAFQQMLNSIVPMVLREQNFLVDLFLFAGAKPLHEDVMALVGDLHSKKARIEDRKASKRLEELMSSLFDGLLSDMAGFIEFSLKQDHTYCICFLNLMEKCKRDRQVEDNPFMNGIFEAVEERLNMAFDRYLDDQLRAVEDIRVSAKKRDGVFPFMRTFPHFVAHMEGFNVDAESYARRRLNVTYERMVKTMFESLEVLAREMDVGTSDDKEQLNAHILIMENMHYFYKEIHDRGVAALENHAKAAKGHYEFHMNAYIKAMVRRPLGKLLEFFEGIEELLKTNSAEEIGFHLNYNKAALKKVVSQYPSKEVKKSMDVLYKRAAKHFTEETGLLRVVWQGIQEEFTRLHRQFEQLMEKCFPGTEVRLSFRVEELNGFFDEIAKN